nr:histidine triad nucleotide-binding protein [Polyangium aurulentum]
MDIGEVGLTEAEMCLFCKIAKKEIPSKVLFEEEDLLAFHDINPMAPIHVLVIPKQHIVGLGEAVAENAEVLGKLLVASRRVAEETGLVQSGFRVVVNNGPHAGQSVFHLHVHVLGGRPLAWPPG